jgi:hypothetical protein
MVLMGPQQLEPVFEELSRELGETISDVVIEAQRRFAKGVFSRPMTSPVPKISARSWL